MTEWLGATGLHQPKQETAQPAERTDGGETGTTSEATTGCIWTVIVTRRPLDGYRPQLSLSVKDGTGLLARIVAVNDRAEKR